jgi:Xaa-Pro aminopeptidase
MMLKFPLDEYADRQKRILVEMEQRGIDALILTSDDNTFYFCGFQSIVWDSKVSTPCVLVITKHGDMMIATSRSGRETAKVTSCIEDIRFYTRDGGKDGGYQSFAKTITSLLVEKRLDSGRIGMEFTNGTKMHLTHLQREDLFKELSCAELVDCSAALWAVRSIKSAAEIGYLRQCCRINHESIAAGFAGVHQGMTELELYRSIVIEYFRKGAERSLLLGIRAGSDRYSQGNCPPSDRPIGRGEIILVDGGPICNGYYSDIIREGVVGKPSDRQLDMFNVARDACYAGIEVMRPGTRIGDVCVAVDGLIERSSYAAFTAAKGHCGHSIGTSVHEFPMLDADCDMILQPGMVFAIEPYFFQDGVGSLGIEENILITESGYENLTPSPSGLIVVDG